MSESDRFWGDWVNRQLELNSKGNWWWFADDVGNSGSAELNYGAHMEVYIFTEGE